MDESTLQPTYKYWSTLRPVYKYKDSRHSLSLCLCLSDVFTYNTANCKTSCDKYYLSVMLVKEQFVLLCRWTDSWMRCLTMSGAAAASRCSSSSSATSSSLPPCGAWCTWSLVACSPSGRVGHVTMKPLQPRTGALVILRTKTTHDRTYGMSQAWLPPRAALTPPTSVRMSVFSAIRSYLRLE